MATATKSSSKKPKATTAKAAVKKPAAKKRAAVKKSTTVDFYPNRMTFWVSAAAGSIIVLIAVIVAYS